MRDRQIRETTTCQSHVAIDGLIAGVDSDRLHEHPMDLGDANLKSKTVEKPYQQKLIIHYTHEKRLDSLKREMHQVYQNVFQNTPVEDVKLIVGTRNRRNARDDLVRKRPKRALLQNKPRKSK
jgi:hypothetical protein